MPSTLHTNGAKIESKITVTDIAAATIPTLLRLKRIQAIWRGLRLTIWPALLALSIFVVETADCPGYRVGRVLDKMGLKAQDTSELFFNDVKVPKANLIGAEGMGFIYLMQELPQERLGIAVNGVAMMEGALALTLDYVRERKAFGQTVADFQNTRFKLAEIKVRTTAVRMMVDQYLAEHLRRKLYRTTIEGDTPF